ncbi:unnamed protein product [Effrenium voratum]|uniref:Uncharacterized protein n=1 Tax=Effrenium voratum TaxID=2562239 RepID=A0AA36NBM8_9DINO|nr:unnamed protein product [Effrenium voratum]
MTKRPGKKKRKLGVWDISRTHFIGRAEREIYIQLPEEDRTREKDAGVPMCGRLLRSMYGTQDASHIFQKDYSMAVKDLYWLVHGGDFMATAADAELVELDKILNTCYTVPNGTEWKLEVEADARHAEILLKAFGFNGKTKGVDMPQEKQVAKDMVIVDQPAELNAEQMGEYRSLVMRMAYLSQDRPDLEHVVRRFLWLQMRVVERNLIVDKVKGTINDADLVTNVQPETAIRSHLGRLGYEAAERRGHKGLTF